MSTAYLHKTQSKHNCGQAYKTRKIPVDERVLALSPYPVDYCPKCNVYTYHEVESSDPTRVANHITKLQMIANLRDNKSPFSKTFLKENP